MSKEKMMRVDTEVFTKIISDIKQDFSRQGVTLSDREATKILGMKFQKKRYIL